MVCGASVEKVENTLGNKSLQLSDVYSVEGGLRDKVGNWLQLCYISVKDRTEANMMLC